VARRKRMKLVGREKEISEIYSFLKKHSNSVVLIQGLAGVGKSLLAKHIAELYAKEFGYRIEEFRWYDEKRISHHEYLENLSKPTINIYHDINKDRKLKDQIDNSSYKYASLHHIVTTRNKLDIKKINIPLLTISLGGLSRNDCTEFLKANGYGILEEKFRAIHDRFFCNPEIFMSFVEMLKKSNVSKIDKFIFESCIEFDNDITDNKLYVPETIKNNTIYVNQNIMEKIAEEPHRMHKLKPREFEEMMAELYQKLGYTVKELTKRTRDGGRDIYLAGSNSIGSFLYIVECKNFHVNSPVGVDIIRHLYGVQELEKEKVTGSILATTSRFTKDVYNLIEEKKIQYRIRLHDYEYIAKLLRDAYLS
jgi:restriction system protein